MIDKCLLEILVCPEDHSSLSEADEALVARLNEAIAAGKIVNRGGEAVKSAIDGGLVRQEEDLLYPIVDGIPVLLVDEAIALDQVRSA